MWSQLCRHKVNVCEDLVQDCAVSYIHGCGLKHLL